MINQETKQTLFYGSGSFSAQEEAAGHDAGQTMLGWSAPSPAAPPAAASASASPAGEPVAQEAIALPTVIVCGQETTDGEIYSRETITLPLALPAVSQAQQPAAEKLPAQDGRGTWTQMLDSWELDPALEQQLDQTVQQRAARQKRILKWGALGAGLALAAGLLWVALSSEPTSGEGSSAQPACPALEAAPARALQAQPRSEPLLPKEMPPPPPAEQPAAASAAPSGSGQSAPVRRLQRKQPQRPGARKRARRLPQKKRLQVRYDRQNNVVEILLPEGAPEPQIQVKQQPGKSK